MSANSATVQGESYVYGGIIFQRVTEADVKKPIPQIAPALGTDLLQGLVTGSRHLTWNDPSDGRLPESRG